MRRQRVAQTDKNEHLKQVKNDPSLTHLPINRRQSNKKYIYAPFYRVHRNASLN